MNKKSTLAPSLEIQPSQLYVKDLSKVGRFYKDMVGLDVLSSSNNRWTLGYDQTPILELVSKPKLSAAPTESAGLFHNAILFSSRTDLARIVLNIIQRAPEHYEGSADHLVSEAFYFHDPENNGLELYYDPPSENWKWINDQVQMDTLYLDPQDYILKHLQGDTDQPKKLGHVHLKVGDIPTAKKFYVDQLGFDITLDMGSALFVSVGGYHHHLGMNTWMSRGAERRTPGLGLGEVKMILPTKKDIDNLASRLDSNKLPFKPKTKGLQAEDPWGNKLLFMLQ